MPSAEPPLPWEVALGATPASDGSVTFRVWAPAAAEMRIGPLAGARLRTRPGPDPLEPRP